MSLTVCLPCPTKDSECIDNGVQTTGSAGGSYVPQQQNLQPPIGVNEDVTGYSMCADLPDQMKDDGGNEQVKRTIFLVVYFLLLVLYFEMCKTKYNSVCLIFSLLYTLKIMVKFFKYGISPTFF